MQSVILLTLVASTRRVKLPFYETTISAGLPVYANDLGEEKIDLYNHLVKNKKTTHVMQVDGDSMDSEIQHGDLLIVDTALEAQNGNIVIARLRDEFVVKRFRCYSNRLWLVPDNPDYEATELKPEDDCSVWGVVTKVIHDLR